MSYLTLTTTDGQTVTLSPEELRHLAGQVPDQIGQMSMAELVETMKTCREIAQSIASVGFPGGGGFE